MYFRIGIDQNFESPLKFCSAHVLYRSAKLVDVFGICDSASDITMQVVLN